MFKTQRIKKLFFVILFVSILGYGINHAFAATNITIDTNNDNGKVGDKIEMTFKVTDVPLLAESVKIFISDQSTLDSADYAKYIKTIFTGVNKGAAEQSFTYTWDTEAAQSVAGQHYVYALIADLSGNKLYQGNFTYYLAAADSTPTPGTTPTGGSGGATGFEIGDLGTIIFGTSKVSSAQDLVIKIIEWLLGFGGALAAIAIIYSGIMYIMAGNDMEKAVNARKNLIWAVTGLIIMFLSLSVVAIIGQLLASP